MHNTETNKPSGDSYGHQHEGILIKFRTEIMYILGSFSIFVIFSFLQISKENIIYIWWLASAALMYALCLTDKQASTW
jgi:hypothetical protein